MHVARDLGARRTVVTACIIPENITWSDWQFMQEMGIAPNDRSTKCESTY
jgi:hypothetical protein